MHFIHTPAFVLQFTHYEEFDIIVHVFTKDLGLIPLFVKGGNRKKSPYAFLKQPLCQIDLLCQKKQGEFYLLKEASPIAVFTQMRQSYKRLKAMLSIQQCLKSCLIHEYSCPDIFILTQIILRNLNQSDSEYTELYLCLFYLKILFFEGLWPIEFVCPSCEQKQASIYIYHDHFQCACTITDRSKIELSYLEFLTCKNLCLSKKISGIGKSLDYKTLLKKLEQIFLSLKK